MSSAPPLNERITAEIRILNDERNETGEVIDFTYEYPYVDTRSQSRTKTHKPIGEEAVVQHLGSDAQEIRVEGGCYRDEANRIDTLTEGGLLRFFSDRWQGDAVVKDTNTSATGEGGGERPGVRNRVYKYTMTLLEIDGGSPASFSF